ncbi:MAG TPA: hypothetical protein VL598_09560 [Trinickia sp.]|uniref:hypothetical protein n=1 Tax=Trinickia sp. TaxID=2571163 RepID=UPI002BF24399|nr:hypothetical protein [Trinickia sp.]HTI17898.1 hypothetical protein [Trinickia sp.]
MKARAIVSGAALAAVLASGVWLTAGTAVAQEAPVDYSLGHARLMPVELTINVGMHGDRYWDGHRYWSHDEWQHHYPHNRDPWARQNDDHRQDEPHHS